MRTPPMVELKLLEPWLSSVILRTTTVHGIPRRGVSLMHSNDYGEVIVSVPSDRSAGWYDVISIIYDSDNHLRIK